MKKKIYIISTSLRVHGNSDGLAQEFMKGAQDAGHDVQVVQLANKDIRFCQGCLVCQKNLPCPIHDDVHDILQSMIESDVIVFATPIYFYEMTGQMKTLLDRTNPAFVKDYQMRDIYLLTTAADGDVSAMDGAIKGLQGWIDCFEKTSLKGIVKAVGTDQYGEIQQKTDFLKQAYELGKNIT